MTIKETLLFPVADALQVALHVVGEGLKAHEPVKTNLSGWEVVCDMKVKSDVLTDKVAAFFVQVRKNLWLYVVSYSDGHKIKAMVFDASVAKITNGFMSTACGQGDLSVSVKHIQKSGGIMYEFTGKEQAWVSCSTFDDVLV